MKIPKKAGKHRSKQNRIKHFSSSVKLFKLVNIHFRCTCFNGLALSNTSLLSGLVSSGGVHACHPTFLTLEILHLVLPQVHDEYCLGEARRCDRLRLPSLLLTSLSSLPLPAFPSSLASLSVSDNISTLSTFINTFLRF